MKQDMGQGLPFRSGIFDGAISISAVQWLCYSNSKGENPMYALSMFVTCSRRLTAFFMSLYNCLRSGARYKLSLSFSVELSFNYTRKLLSRWS